MMYDQVLEKLRKATELALQVQQDMFQTWANYWAGRPAQVQALQKKWADLFSDLLKKQQETLEAQVKVGLKIIEEAFAMPTGKDTEELRGRLSEDWKKSVESLRQLAEAQLQAFQAAVTKQAELATKS